MGPRIDNRLGMMGDNGLDVGHRDVLVVTGQDHQAGAPRLTQLAGDLCSVESHDGVAPRRRQRRPVRQRSTQTEPDHPDAWRTQATEVSNSLADVVGRLWRTERPHEGDDAAGFGSTGTEEQIRGDGRVPGVGQPLAQAEQLGGDPIPFVNDDDARRRTRADGSSEEIRKGDIRHLLILSWRPDPGDDRSSVIAVPTTPDTSLDLGSQAQRHPEATAVIMGGSGQTLSYREVDEGSNRFARLLRARGLTTGDHVAILMENTISYLEVAWGAQRSGLYYTALNNHLRSSEVQYILDDCGATALVATPAMAEVVSRLDLDRVPVRLVVGGTLPGFDDYEAATRPMASTPVDDQSEGREMLYSSGTTGQPKGVRKVLPATALGDPSAAPVQIAMGMAAAGTGPGSIYLSPAPLYHSAPLVYSMSMLRLGATVLIMESFDPVTCLALIERYGVTHAQFVPTMFVRMLKLTASERSRYDLSSLRYVVHAAAPCPVDVKRQMLEWWGPIIHEYYAGTEDIGSTFITAEEWLAHPGSVGRPLAPAHIVGPNGEDLGPGQEGTVYFEGGRPFEYHNDPAKTASITDSRGWRTLGDVGFLDADGYLFLTDRQAHMIISGGVNIYPQEAENVLAGHPSVIDVAVFGVPDPEMGEAVKAVVQPVHPSSAGPELEAALIDYCRGQLATYKCPRTIDFAAELPRDPNGKLYKRLLRDRYWEGHDTRLL
jgi:long-chain acyl-CoA synthetase